MKNFPSALIKQKTTRQGLGDSLSSTLKNVGSKVLRNIFSNGNIGEDLTIDKISQDIIDSGYETLDIEHEIENININKFQNKLNDIKSAGDINKIIYRHNQSVSLFSNLENGKKLSEDNSLIDNNKKDNTLIYFEDPFLYSSSIFSVINTYKYLLSHTIPDILEHPKPKSNEKNSDSEMVIIHTPSAQSLFNPYFGVPIVGTVDTSLLNDDNLNNKQNQPIEPGTVGPPSKDKSFLEKKLTLGSMVNMSEIQQKQDLSDCSIKKLVELSNEDSKTRELGLATYRYIDFMFCKDLGRMPNNHLITLRRFPGPIGDNIFKGACTGNQNNLFESYPDIGRLITWFGNGDNSLESICRFNYHATFKEFTAAIQQEPSQQKDDGILDKIANSFSPQNNRLVSKGFSSNTGLLQYGSGLLQIPIIGRDNMNNQYYDWKLLSNYDQNRIYEPQNVIWSTHKYEGRLEFSQDISLTFRYKLRSYDNINPKAAFLDLLGNIMAVTYRRGSFWGGQTKIYGPQGNNSVYKTADAWIDKGWEKLGGIWNLFASGQFTLQMLQGWLGNVMNLLGEGVKQAQETLETATSVGKTMMGTGDAKDKNKTNQVKEKAEKTLRDAIELNRKYGFTDALKGMLKNQLGRPALYAFNSLLTGEEVGPWHLTIGNPRNPIMSMGNMIITDSEIEQSGPLGLDDFPSEIKLVVKLRHGRPRDSVEIEKMYNKGRGSIYKPMSLVELNRFESNREAFGDIPENQNKKTLQKILANI